jgi:uncharacterized membrane protein YGL010W
MIGNLNREAITMKVMLWIYAIVGSLYWAMSFDPRFVGDVIARYAVGPMWLLMQAAPVVLMLLVLEPVLRRLIK